MVDILKMCLFIIKDPISPPACLP